MGRWLVDRVAIVLAVLLVASVALTVCSLVRPFALVHQREDWHTAQPGVRTAITNAVGMHITAVDVLDVFRNGTYSRATHLYRASAGASDSAPIEQTDRTFAIKSLSGGQVPAGAGRSLLLPLVAVPAFVGLLVIAFVRWKRRRGPITFWPLLGSWALTATVFGLELLVVAAATFCVRSYPYFERFDWRILDDPAAVQVNSSRGSLMLAWTESGPNHSLPSGSFLFTRSTIPDQRGPLYEAAELKPGFHHALGFTLGSDGTSGPPLNVLIVPYWFVILVAGGAALGLGRFERHRRRAARRMMRGLCRCCGYDLRGSEQRCPECGTPASTPSTDLPTIAPTP